MDSTLCERITGKHNCEYEDGDSKTHHVDVVQRFFNTSDEDADDDVADADDTTAASRFSRSLIWTDKPTIGLTARTTDNAA